MLVQFSTPLQYSTWIGGSILAGLSTFKKVSILPFLICIHHPDDPNRCGCLRRSTKKIQILFIAGRCETRLAFGVVVVVKLACSRDQWRTRRDIRLYDKQHDFRDVNTWCTQGNRANVPLTCRGLFSLALLRHIGLQLEWMS